MLATQRLSRQCSEAQSERVGTDTRPCKAANAAVRDGHRASCSSFGRSGMVSARFRCESGRLSPHHTTLFTQAGGVTSCYLCTRQPPILCTSLITQAYFERGSHPSSSNSKESMVRARATAQLTNVQSFKLVACCQSPRATTVWGLRPCRTTQCQHSPRASTLLTFQSSFPSVGFLVGVPLSDESRSDAPASRVVPA